MSKTTPGLAAYLRERYLQAKRPIDEATGAAVEVDAASLAVFDWLEEELSRNRVVSVSYDGPGLVGQFQSGDHVSLGPASESFPEGSTQPSHYVPARRFTT